MITTSISRRAALFGAAASSAALAVPAIAALPNPAHVQPLPPPEAQYVAPLAIEPILQIGITAHTADTIQAWLAANEKAADLSLRIRDCDRVNPKRIRPNGRISGPTWGRYFNAVIKAEAAKSRMLAAMIIDPVLGAA